MKSTIKLDDIQLKSEESNNVTVVTVNNLTTTSSGSALDASQGKILNDLINEIKAGSTVTIATLVSQLATLSSLVTGTTPDGDALVNTIQELLTIFSTYPEGASVSDALAGKINTSAIVNNLTQTIAGSVLDARQGKVLKDAIDTLQSQINSLSAGSSTAITNNLSATTAGSALDAVQGKILSDLIVAIKGGSTVSIATLVAQYTTLNTLVTGTTPDGDSVVNTIQELLTIFQTYPEGADIASALALKVNNSDVLNVLTQVAAGKVLDARQGKVLSDLIVLRATVDSPTFTGTPSAPTPIAGDASTKLATTQFVATAVASVTGVTYDITTATRDAIQTAITNASAGKRLVLAPLNYTGFTGSNPISISGKTGVTIDGCRGANLVAPSGNILILNGDNLDTRITGLNLSINGTTGGGSGIILFNEQGSQNGLEIDHCKFNAPTYRTNGITSSAYSVAANGGSGNGKLSNKIRIYLNDFSGLGRCGVELVNHSWDDAKTNVYLKDIQIWRNKFNDLGKVAETDGTTYNGMAVSVSGLVYDVLVDANEIDDAKLLGIELAGTAKAVVSKNIIRGTTNSFVGVSVSDNNHSATRNINVCQNIIEGRTIGIKCNQVHEFNLTDNDVIQTVQTGDVGSVYIQDSSGGTISGGSVNCMSNNNIRLDNSSKVMIGGGMRLINLTNTYSLVSIYGGVSPGSTYNKVNGADMYFEKSSGPSTTGNVEVYGTYISNNTVVQS